MDKARRVELGKLKIKRQVVSLNHWDFKDLNRGNVSERKIYKKYDGPCHCWYCTNGKVKKRFKVERILRKQLQEFK
jgi:hypothetical protein